jgi:hypothetical protein
MLNETSNGLIAMIEGGTDTEHFAALYLTYLCDPPDHQGVDKHYSASEMWKALQSTIKTVENIQRKHNVNVDNYLNICTSMCFSSFCSQSNRDRSRWGEPTCAVLPLQGRARYSAFHSLGIHKHRGRVGSQEVCGDSREDGRGYSLRGQGQPDDA